MRLNVVTEVAAEPADRAVLSLPPVSSLHILTKLIGPICILDCAYLEKE